MFDKRLFRLVPACARAIACTVLLKWAALAAQAVFLVTVAHTLAAVLQEGSPSFGSWGAFAAVALTALALQYLFQVGAARVAGRAGSRAVSGIVQALYGKLVRLGPGFEQATSTHEVVQLMGEGAERIRPYASGYVPQFFFAVIAPLTLFACLLAVSWPAAAVMLACVVLMPVSIMVLMKRAKKFMGRYWGTYVDLGGAFMNAVRGLTTLKVFEADAAMQRRLDAQAEGFRQVTMRLLRVQLNSVTLMDLFSYGGMVAGALVALAQAAAGVLPLSHALVVVLLAPSFFMPMREFGSQFHTGMNAQEVLDSVFELLDAPEPQAGSAKAPGEQERLGMKALECTGLSCSYGDGTAVLRGVDLSIEPMTFAGVTGESGSGKSMLVRAVAGQLPSYEGSIRIFGTELRELDPKELRGLVTVVSYDSHVFKGTVRSNLLLGKPSANDYEMWEALRRARLDDFVIALGGLSARVTEDGSNLSGGQRQRLCFARALLRDTPLYLFDEAASNVDAESEKALLTVMQELSLQKTVVLVTHRLASLARADEVFVMDAGTVAERGTHYALVRTDGGLYQRLWRRNAQLEEFAAMADAVELDDAYEPNEVEKVLDSLPPQASQMMYAALMTRDALKYKRQVEGDAYDPVLLGHPEWIPLPGSYREDAATGSDGAWGDSAQEATRDAQTGSGAEPARSSLRTLRAMRGVMRGMRAEVVLAIVMGSLSNAAAVALPAFAVSALVAAVQGAPFAALAAAAVACGVLRGPLHYAERLLVHSQTFKTLALLRRRVFAKLRELAPARLEARDSADLVSLLTSDIEQLEGFCSRVVTPLGAIAATALGAVVALVALGAVSLALLAAVACAVVVAGIPALATRATRAKARDLRSFSVEMTAFLLDSLRGFPDLLQFGRAAEYAEEIDGHMGTAASGDMDLARTSSWFAPLARTAALASDALALALVAVSVGAGTLAPLPAAVAFVLFTALMDRAASAAGFGFSLARVLACAERVLGVLAEQPKTADVDGGAQVQGFSGAAFDAVTFAYPGSSRAAVEGIDLRVSPGSLVRVTGKSGAGKSTLLKLLMRFWDASSGSVSVSGCDVRRVATRSLRALEGYMTQETYLFEGTLRENLLLGKDVPDQDLLALLAQVRLDGLMARLEGGLDAQVGGSEGAGRLSAGERQRVGLARALLHGAPLLLLDEPTSNLDSLSEAAVLYALAQTTQDKTVVVVSHRKAVAALADATYVVRKRA